MNYKYFWVPYSVLSVASYMYKNKYEVKIIDNNTDIMQKEYDAIEEHIRNSSVVGISCFIGKQIIDGIEFAKKVKLLNRNIKIIWGGYAPTLLPNLFLGKEYVDFIVKGSNELSFYHIVEGICNKEYKGSINCKASSFDISSRPLYPYSMIDVNEYIKNDPEIATRTINYVASQGCPYSCAFCSDVAMYKSRHYSINRNRIISDVKYLHNNFRINGVKFYDSNFFAVKKRVFDFIEDLKHNKIDIKWAASAHPNNLLSLNSVEWELLVGSGCTRVLIGAESGCQEVLDMVKKNTTLEKIRIVAKNLAKYNIIGSFTFIVGFPAEPLDAVRKTIEYSKELLALHPKFEAKIHFYLPYPGTPMFDKAVSYGFKPPACLEEWAYFDYYNVEMPWVDKSLYDQIRKFNEINCPYVNSL